ncbi:unnamed protein product [Symbiodinium natans]|uniref:Uncharacterized protein n=1 Tax=Symbiodinium natans TaxID=878477 RepID=A0A812QWG7_9DINO|nr:unnamed protein product [Symbiodinium natans]
MPRAAAPRSAAPLPLPLEELRPFPGQAEESGHEVQRPTEQSTSPSESTESDTSEEVLRLPWLDVQARGSIAMSDLNSADTAQLRRAGKGTLAASVKLSSLLIGFLRRRQRRRHGELQQGS